MQSILRTGFGVLTHAAHFEKLSAQYVSNLMRDKGFIVVRGVNLDREQLVNVTKQYGRLIEYIDDKKKDKAAADYKHKYIFDVDGSENKKVRGRGELPIHADGGLLRTPVHHIMLYANEIQNIHYGGGTGIIDHKLAVEEMPPHLRRVVEEERFETLGLEDPYYSNMHKDDWTPMPFFEELGWVRQVRVYVNYKDASEASWRTRIIGFSDKEVKAFFDELCAFVCQPRYCYLHFWSKGDLLIMDNRRVIHYREPFHSGAKRVILRTQSSEN